MIQPLELFRATSEVRLLPPPPSSKSFALLGMGKLAPAHLLAGGTRMGNTWMGRAAKTLWLGPSDGDHPVPGVRSQACAERLLEFFAEVQEAGIERLEVVLSGGASSLVWLPRVGQEASSRAQAQALYQAGLSIQELNRRRAQLCQLKAGGAARWMRWLAPKLLARVQVVSDVEPFGLDVVGGGPFWGEGIPHVQVASNTSWLKRWIRQWPLPSDGRWGWKVTGKTLPGPQWVEQLNREIDRPRGVSTWFLWGGEALWKVPPGSGRGGRLSHLAAALVASRPEAWTSGRVSGLFFASDGVDGTSGLGGVDLLGHALGRMDLRALERALTRFDTGTFWRSHRAGLPAGPTGINLGDVVLVRVNPGPERFF